MGALLTQFMNRYAYTDFHELNADWLIKTLMEMINQVENFVSLNAIKYADPIQWDIVRQYEKNTVVIDPLTGTAYISVQPVPSGVALSRTEYWTVVFDLGSFVTRAAKNFSNRYEADTTLTATFPTSTGDWLVWGDTLYEALVNITAGDQYVVGSNIKHITMEEVADVLAQAIQDVQNNVDTLDTKVGDLNDLTTSVTTSVVLAINSVLDDLNLKIGDLADLTTTDKSSIVDAINEVDGDVGDLANLTTTDKSSTVNAINEIDAIINNLNVFNVKDYGAVADGVTDDSPSVIAAYNDMPSSGGILYFPPGTYQLDTPVNVTKPITVYFNDATVLCGAPLANFQINSSNVQFKGKANFGNNGGARLALIFNGYTNIVFDLDCNVVSFVSDPLITSVQNAFIVVKGKYSTQDSMIFLANGSSYVDVSGVMALYTSTPALGPIICTDSDPTHTYSHINIHDNFVEGGGVLINGCITVTRSEQTDGVSGKNYLPIKDVKITNNTVVNTAGITDGIDIIFCDGVTVVNNNVNHCFEGIAILADNVVVANCICTENRSAGIYIGDLNIGSSGTYWSLITITNCIMANNGYGSDPNARNAAFACDQPATCYASSIYVENCFMFGSDWSIYFGDNTGGSNIRISNCFTVGTSGALRYIAGQEGQFKMSNNAGYNPLGFITPPAVSTTPVVNDTTTDVFVTVMNGATGQTININGTALAYVQPNDTYGCIVPKGVSISVGTDATGVTWSWYAL